MRSFQTKIREAWRQLPYVLRTLQLVHQAAGRTPYFWALMLAVQGLVPAGIVYTTKLLVDAVAAALSGGLDWANVASVAYPALLMGGLMLIQQLLGSIIRYLDSYQTELVADHVKSLIHRKAAAVDYLFYESSTYHDQLEQANAQSASRSLGLLQNFGSLLRSTVTFVSIAALLVSYSPFIPLLLVLSAGPAFYVLIRYNKKNHDWWERTTADRRWTTYFDHCLTGKPIAAELRVYGLGDYFHEQYQNVRGRLREEKLALIREQMRASVLARLLALGVTAGAMIWIVRRAMLGQAQLGDLALFYSAFVQAEGLMRTLLGSIGQVFTNVLFLEHLFGFLDQEVSVSDPSESAVLPDTLQHGIGFENITFRYPDAEEYALRDFSLYIPAGQTVAIVGANGAGKSTLIKLLCRFYDPEQGSVTVDGTDIRSYNLEDFRRRLAIMFQIPARYHATVNGNIAVGAAEGLHGPEEVRNAAVHAGAHDFVSRLPYGYDTLLGRMFEKSLDLSGGEWQRLALARAYLRHSPIVALDEPTSSIDSWTENEWFDKFRSIVKKKTAIIITHRFTTAKHADVIYVMDRGEIVEYGTHNELVSMGGRYAESWNAQMYSHSDTEEPEAVRL